jgi:hypothetical protein
MTRGPFCTTGLKRAKDLTDQDVIRHQGMWREILDIYHDWEDVWAVHSQQTLEEPWAAGMKGKFTEAFDNHWEDSYVVLRLLDQNRSTPAEIEDIYVVMYTYDLAEVQSLPRWEPRKEAE